jgi:uncharacterized protein
MDLPLDPEDLAAITRLEALIADSATLGVALSGGVDSSVLLGLAARALGAHKVLAVIGVSSSLAAVDRLAAHDVACHLGVRVLEVATKEGERPDYRLNGPDRCFHCRDELFSVISAEAVRPLGLRAVAYGEIVDDRGRRDRPGARAARFHGVLTPLADAGIDKAAVRRIAQALGLPTAERPAAPCLASRIPHFVPVDPEKLLQIERAEAALRELGLDDLRVRHHGDIARIEAPWSAWAALTDDERGTASRRVREAGFRYAAVDLDGLTSGTFTLEVLDVNRADAP